VCVSEATRRAFMTTYGNRFRFVETIPLYVRDAISVGDAVAPSGVTAPFLLTVAATEVRKNYLRSIAAFADSGLGRRGYRYVICGPRGNAEREVRAAAEATPNVVRLGFVPDAELRWLYGHAAGFVLPSLLEGFGIPALEASRHGLVSIVSAGGAQEEAVGQGGLLVDPEKVDSIAQGMAALVDMPDAERQRRLSLCAQHVALLSRQQFLARWSALLDRG
jgi:glycosyltransferase involved in cell wall biosynthesis